MMLSVSIFQTAKTADDYFRGGGRVPRLWLGQCICYYVASHYIYVNSRQSVYFRLTFIIGQYLAIAILPLVFYFYIPFSKLKVISHEYLEARFDVRCRPFASMSFMLFRGWTYRYYHFHRAGLCAPSHKLW